MARSLVYRFVVPGGSGAARSVAMKSEPVISRIALRNVRYDQNQLTIVDTRFRAPTSRPMWTSPQSHHAGAPQSFTRPKSTTADFRPIVARLPRWRYAKGPGGGAPLQRARMCRATYAPACFAAAA